MNHPRPIVFVVLLLLANQAFPQQAPLLLNWHIPTGNGTVSFDPEKSIYSANEEVTITAIPKTACYEFTHWSGGDCTGTKNPCTLIMDTNKWVKANFERKKFSLQIDADHGDVSKSPDKTIYGCNAEVILTAKPDMCYQFARWEGVTTTQDTSATVTMDQDQEVTAVFEPIENTLTITPKSLDEIAAGAEVTFQVNGGKGPYTWRTTHGQVQSDDEGLSAIYTAPETAPENGDGVTTITVQDQCNKKTNVDVERIFSRLALSPSTKTLYEAEQFVFSVQGGKPPYQGTFTAGQNHVVPITDDDNDGVFSLTITTPSVDEEITETLTVRDELDQEQSAEITIVNVPELFITPQSATRQLGDSHAILFEGFGGIAPYLWGISEGNVEHEGTKAIYQPPTKVGEHRLTLSDQRGTTVTALVRVISVPVITPGYELLFTAQSTDFQVSGGEKPYNWYAEAGHLSATEGSAINYTAPNIKGLYTVTVTDGQNNQSKAIVHVVAAGSLMCSPSKSVVAVDEAAPLAVAYGVPPYTWQDGRQGRTFEARFDLMGRHEVEARDAQGNACVAEVNVINGDLSITPATSDLQPGEVAEFAVTGGSDPYTWTADVGSLSSTEGQQISYVASDKPGRYHLTVTDSRTTVQGSAEVIVTAPLVGGQPGTDSGQIRSGIKIDGVSRPEQRILIDQGAQAEINFPLEIPKEEKLYNIYCAVLWKHPDRQIWLFRTSDPAYAFVPFDLASGKPFPIYSQAKSGENLVVDVRTGSLNGLLGEFDFHLGYAPTAAEDQVSTLIWNQVPYTLVIQ